MLVWVIGRGGMLGSAMVEHVERSAGRVFTGSTVPWHDRTATADELSADARRFADEASSGPWAVIWMAGSSVVASSTEATSTELGALEVVLTALVQNHPSGPGAFFLTSSAGGVYAGSVSPPFDVGTEPRPISPYGELKLQQEALTHRLLDGAVPVVIGRFSNLYGPQHKEDKAQGLIPQLCRATIRRTPLNLYVSMDTVRDYLYVDDAAAMAWDAIERMVTEQSAEHRLVVIASGQPTTVAQVIATVQNVAHRRVPVALGTHPSSQHQVIDLRLTPSPDLIARHSAMTTLPSGVKRVFDALIGSSG